MDYNNQRKQILYKCLNEFEFIKLKTDDVLLTTNIWGFNPIFNRYDDESKSLSFYDEGILTNSHWYLSKNKSIVIQLTGGNKEPNIFLFRKEIKKSFFLNKSRLIFEMYSISKLKHNSSKIFETNLNLDELEDNFIRFCSRIDNMIDKGFSDKRQEKIQKLKENKMKESLELKETQSNILNEFDKDNNGIIDIIEGDDFMSLFRKHQSIIKEFDKQYINYLVKISNYLKIKKNNIQNIFSEISKTNNQSKLIENVGLLKNQIHTYEVILFHSLNLITSIVEDDLITVNEIYEEFDKLKIFKSDHEKEVSQQLSEIGDGLNNLMYSINSMERNIVSGLNNLSYVTQDGFSDLNNSLTRELESIGSSIETNNLLTGIQTYQMYKINKNTKSLN